jgi:leucine dehydrogenase
MTAFWTEPDFDDHEVVQLVRDHKSGLTGIIAVHSTHLGPAGGGTRFWHYADPAAGLRDCLRLSRGMSYKNAMAGLKMGGGKAVILADETGHKTRDMLIAFADAIEGLGGKYVTAEDVGMTDADMETFAERTAHVSGLPTKGADAAGGDPGPFTALGIYYGIKAAVRFKLGREDMSGVHVALQGTGSVGSGAARLLAEDGAQLTLADIDEARAAALAKELSGKSVAADEILQTECDVFSPNALGGVLTKQSIAKLKCPIVAGGANNQLAGAEDGQRLAARGILYAPDYVINAGGIISVAAEYFARTANAPGSVQDVKRQIAKIPERLENIWRESEADGIPADQVADSMAQKLIGR